MFSLTKIHKCDFREACDIVIRCHYLHKPPHPMAMTEGYWITTQDDMHAGLLLFGRPQSTMAKGWYGPGTDTTKWQILNLSRVWIDPDYQPGGALYESTPGYQDRHGNHRSTLASDMIKAAIARIGRDYLLARPPVFLDHPYVITWLLSYCDVRFHRGTIYEAANFELYSQHAHIRTFRIQLPPLTITDNAIIIERSLLDERAIKKRLQAGISFLDSYKKIVIP